MTSYTKHSFPCKTRWTSNCQTQCKCKNIQSTSGPFWALIMTNYTKYSLRILLKQGSSYAQPMSIEQYCKAEDFSRMIFMMWMCTLWKFWREKIIEIAMFINCVPKYSYSTSMWCGGVPFVEYLFSGRMCAGHWVLNRDRRKLIKSQNRSRFVMKYRFINHVANKAEFRSS